MYRLFRQADECSELKGFLSAKLLLSAVLLLVMYVAELSENMESISGGAVDPQIAEVLKYINKNYRSELTLDALAEAAGMSKFYLCRKFREVTGATVMEYLNNVRLTKVHSMLINTTNSIDEIAVESGFSSSVNLSRAFKKLYGISPSEFRRSKKKIMIGTRLGISVLSRVFGSNICSSFPEIKQYRYRLCSAFYVIMTLIKYR